MSDKKTLKTLSSYIYTGIIKRHKVEYYDITEFW